MFLTTPRETNVFLELNRQDVTDYHNTNTLQAEENVNFTGPLNQNRT